MNARGLVRVDLYHQPYHDLATRNLGQHAMVVTSATSPAGRSMTAYTKPLDRLLRDLRVEKG